MGITVIVELRAKPGRRDELADLLERIVGREGASAPGFVGSTRFEVLDEPDMLAEIADWESAQALAAHMQESTASGAYAPRMEVLAEPPRATVIQRLP